MEVQGFADGRFGPVRRFTEIAGAQPGTGAAFAVWCDGLVEAGRLDLDALVRRRCPTGTWSVSWSAG
jgi:hypothetical protein